MEQPRRSHSNGICDNIAFINAMLDQRHRPARSSSVGRQTAKFRLWMHEENGTGRSINGRCRQTSWFTGLQVDDDAHMFMAFWHAVHGSEWEMERRCWKIVDLAYGCSTCLIRVPRKTAFGSSLVWYAVTRAKLTFSPCLLVTRLSCRPRRATRQVSVSTEGVQGSRKPFDAAVGTAT